MQEELFGNLVSINKLISRQTKKSDVVAHSEKNDLNKFTNFINSLVTAKAVDRDGIVEDGKGLGTGQYI